MAERYIVELEIKRVGDAGIAQLTAKTKTLERGFDSFKKNWSKGWSDLGSAVSPVGHAIDNVVGKALSIGTGAVMAGGAAIFAGATYGVVKLNTALESTKISLGTIFSAQGMASSVPAGMQKASTLIKDMKVDAQKLPGTFNDLMEIFTTAAIPGFRSGASIDQMRVISSQLMAAGKVAQMDMGMVAREASQLMEGRAGSHNVLGMKLMGLTGDKAKAFNAQSADKRLAEMSKELQKYNGGIDAFSDSFDAQSSTLEDNVQNFAQVATAQLFGSVKDTMKEANAWFSEHQDEVKSFATHVGYMLNNAFTRAKALILEWGPAILDFANVAYDRVVAIWQDVQPWVQKFADTLREAIADPNGTIDKLIVFAKLYAALKVGGTVVNAGLGIAQAITAVKTIGTTVGLLGGGSAAAGAAGAGGASAVASTTAAGAAAAGGIGAAGVAAIAAAVPVAVAGALAYGAWGGVKTKEDHDQEAVAAGQKRAADLFEEMTKQGVPANEMLARTTAEADFMQAQFQTVTAAAFSAAMALNGIHAPGGGGAPAGETGAEAKERIANQMKTEGDRNFADVERANAEAFEKGKATPEEESWSTNQVLAQAAGEAALRNLDKNAKEEAALQKKRDKDLKSKGGGGGTKQTVQITVTSNQHPSRIAREIVGHLGKALRNPTSSQHVNNFGALEDA